MSFGFGIGIVREITDGYGAVQAIAQALQFAGFVEGFGNIASHHANHAGAADSARKNLGGFFGFSEAGDQKSEGCEG